MSPLPGLGTALRAARDGFYIAVGAGVLAFQRAQVQRRELEAKVGDLLGRSGSAQPSS